MTDTWHFIQEKSSAGIAVLLLYVLHSQGSSPGRQGFKMSVAADSSFSGSIGGGIMEHKFVELARSLLSKGELKAGVFRQVHDKSTAADQSGMICSGEQTIFLYPIRAHDMEAIRHLICSLEKQENGTLKLTPAGIRFSTSIPAANYAFEKLSQENFVYTEKTGPKNILHIVGGGHCSLALSRLMGAMDFYIHLYDERRALNTIEENSWAHQKHFPGSYSELDQMIEGGENAYVVIMTVGYRTDKLAVRALAEKKFCYFGVLGSKAKMEILLNELSAELDPRFLQTIRAPAGVAIKSQTPEEIAVSIAAEIIAEKNRDQ